VTCSVGEDYYILKYFEWKYKLLASKIAHDAIVGYWGLTSLAMFYSNWLTVLEMFIVLMKDVFFITD